MGGAADIFLGALNFVAFAASYSAKVIGGPDFFSSG
jgi:hypothetical protein